MSKPYEIIYMDTHTPEWYEFRRTKGIGGSEAGTVMGINKYETWIRTFHEKVGLMEPRKDDNYLMFWGREHEDKIAEIWQYWDDTPEGYIHNKANNKIIRQCRNVNGYIVNPKYPWLFGSLDRIINKKGGFSFITGEPLEKPAPLECKALTYWASQVWESGIPEYFNAQIHTYMIIMEVDYAEIAILKDGNKFSVEYRERDPELVEKLLHDTKHFWYERVIPAREAYEQRVEADLAGDYEMAEKYDAIIQGLEPPADDTEAYKEYMSKKFLHEREKVQGTFALYDAAKKDEVLKKLRQEIDRNRRLISNQMIEYLVKNHSDLIDFGKDGTVRWYTKKNIDTRILAVNLKEKPTDEAIFREFQKINQLLY